MYNVNVKNNRINQAIEAAIKSPIRTWKNIKFSKNEIDYIIKLNKENKQKAIFIMMSLFKFYNNWFYVADRELFRLAKIPWAGTSNSVVSKCLFGERRFLIKEISLKANSHIRKLVYYPNKEIENMFDDSNIAFEVDNPNMLIDYYINYRDSIFV